MTTVNIYLTFNGNCKQAFDFYKSIFGGDYPYVGSFGEMPPQAGMEIPESMKDKIMHISLPISQETMLMGSDTSEHYASDFTMGNNFSISVNTKDPAEAERIFKALAQNGTIKMPLEKTFWEAYFGMLTDQFGINWQVNCELAGHQDFEKNN
ncbi:MAG: VOC family protein [Crocinitomicaceae bacterium]|jgi:PhnB protein|nr:VOC family protein [Crocinitomicaceae bacterium]